jgi:hypothetical protein
VGSWQRDEGRDPQCNAHVDIDHANIDCRAVDLI